MKKYKNGLIISLAMFIVLLMIDSQVYGTVMMNSVLVILLILHVLFFHALREDRRYKTYIGFVVVFAAAVYMSLPGITQQQALERAQAVYALNTEEMATVLVTGSNEWDPFRKNEAYVFRGTANGEAISAMVAADTGKVFKIAE